VPTFTRYRDVLNKVREWANGTTLDAETALPYEFREERVKQDESGFDQVIESSRARQIGKKKTKKEVA
jgi:hypothetical protein